MPVSVNLLQRAFWGLAFAAAALHVSSAEAYPLRVEAGGGYSQGDTSGTFSGSLDGATGTAHFDGLGGNGLSATGAIWIDGLFSGSGLNDISWGVQYLHIQNTASFQASVTVPTTTTTLGPLSINLSGPPITVAANLDINLNAAMFNMEWRRRRGDVHPYMGLGIGEAFNDVSAHVAANINDKAAVSASFPGGQAPAPFEAISLPALSFNTTIPITLTANTPIAFSRNSFAAQLFVGADMDIAPGWYAGAGANLLETGSAISNLVLANSKLHSNTRQLSVFAHVGWYLN